LIFQKVGVPFSFLVLKTGGNFLKIMILKCNKLNNNSKTGKFDFNRTKMIFLSTFDLDFL